MAKLVPLILATAGLADTGIIPAIIYLIALIFSVLGVFFACVKVSKIAVFFFAFLGIGAGALNIWLFISINWYETESWSSNFNHIYNHISRHPFLPAIFAIPFVLSIFAIVISFRCRTKDTHNT